ncbi:hypothetical protein EJ04DRAFT_266280 [Polyplosphaeria fusca]|uniref:Transcription factor hoxa13 n=1 Tax=Polyplosphaeria fusca TaxID=682080 RepID=A0A9P4QZ08_9PLEO|nr:hypothetical protein EJ04DRAFT_266280 [Polyplosphaeria fusca]
MGAQSNGRARKPKSTQNGHLNGHLNGSTNKDVAKTVVRPTAQNKPRRSITASLLSVVGRIITWYTIITIAFRCPSSITQLSETSPRICSPYLHGRSYAAPYLDPYYHTYLAPQVEKVQPYIDGFDSRVYTPLATFTKDKYATYGAHRVGQAQKYLEAEWDRTIRPQLDNAQTQAKSQYDVYLGAHVQKASDMLTPYYEQTKDSCVEIYHLSILPAYEMVLPYSKQGYAYGHHIVTHIVFPYVRSAKDHSWTFVTRTIWPQLRILYGDNVEPQLVRIRERLGRHKDQKKVESIVDAIESESTAIPVVSDEVTETPAAASPSTSSSSSSSAAGWNVLDNLWPAEPKPTPSSKTEIAAGTATQPAKPKLTGDELRESLNNDLRQWQNKFATAADKGAEDLEQRVAEITKGQVENSVKGHGSALVVQLEETTQNTIKTFKQYIQDTVKSVNEDSTEQELELAYEKCIAKTRELGILVKEKAQAVRTWKTNYDQELDSLVKSAVDSTVAVLDRIHDLGLQEIGMRWAWTDGVTYKDWKNYHKLKHTLENWRGEVEAVGSRHEGLKVAHAEGKSLEDDAMNVATKMVNELVRLKDVAKWKIWAGDATDDFSDKKVPVRVFKAAESVLSHVDEASSKASEAIVGSETPASESIASSLKDKVVDASSKISESFIGSETPATESVASTLKDRASEASSMISEAVMPTEEPVESSASEAAESANTAVHEAKSKVEEQISSATETPKKVMGGAYAQVIAEAREIIFDDVIDEEDTYSQRVKSLAEEAGDRAAEITKALSEALLGPSKTQGAVESATSLAGEQYEKAFAAASRALYGTDQKPIESMTSVASEKFADAVTAASYAIYGTPTATAVIETVQIVASSRYSEAISLANEQYSNAKSQFSELISGTRKPAHETLLSMVEKAYSDSVAAASERLQAAIPYTDSIKSYVAGPTQGYLESVSSVAASKLSEGISAASAQFGPQPTSGFEGARRQYYEAIGLAHARYSEFLGAASSAVYGPQQGTFESIASGASKSAASVASDVSEVVDSVASQVSTGVVGSETPWTESVASQASQNWEALIAKASSQVYGAPTPWAESVYSQAGAYGAQATAQAAEQYAAMTALISELVVGKEPDFTESVLLRFSAAYYTGLPGVMSSVNSLASENYEAATSYAGDSYDAATSYVEEAYSSAASVVQSIFTPPPAIETILSQANAQLEAAVESASIAVYGTPKGRIEDASESIASAYSSVQSKASEVIYGTQQAQDSFAAVAVSAQAAISEAIFGTPATTGYAAQASSNAESVYSSMSSVASQKAAEAASAISSAVYGPEQGAMESASSRLAAAVEAANSRIGEMYAGAAKTAEEAASAASSVVSSATERVKDEL